MSLIITVATILAFVPAMFWFLLYRWLDKKDPEPKKAMMLTGILGVLATIPIFGLQFGFQIFPEYNFMQILQYRLANPFFFSLVFLGFVSIIEEVAKAISTVGAMEYYERECNQIVDGIVYAASAALGFSFAENIYYFYLAYESLGISNEFLAVYAIRSLGTMLGHTLFTGVFGFYYAKAYLAPYADKDLLKKKVHHNFFPNFIKAVTFNHTRRSILPRKEHSFEFEHPGIVIMEGVFAATFLHFIYNFFVKVELFGKTWTFLIVPFLFFAAWGVWRAFFKDIYTKVFVIVTQKKKSIPIIIKD